MSQKKTVRKQQQGSKLNLKKRADKFNNNYVKTDEDKTEALIQLSYIKKGLKLEADSGNYRMSEFIRYECLPFLESYFEELKTKESVDVVIAAHPLDFSIAIVTFDWGEALSKESLENLIQSARANTFKLVETIANQAKTGN